MGAISPTFFGQKHPLRLGHGSPTQTVFRGGLRKKYRLTVLFGVTAVMVITTAAILVNIIVGRLAEDNLVRIAEENTARDGLHIQSMMRMGHFMDRGSSTEAVHSREAMQDMGQPVAHGMPPGPAAESDDNIQEMKAPMTPRNILSEAGGGTNVMQDIQNHAPLELQSLAGPSGLPMS